MEIKIDAQAIEKLLPEGLLDAYVQLFLIKTEIKRMNLQDRGNSPTAYVYIVKEAKNEE